MIKLLKECFHHHEPMTFDYNMLFHHRLVVNVCPQYCRDVNDQSIQTSLGSDTDWKKLENISWWVGEPVLFWRVTSPPLQHSARSPRNSRAGWPGLWASIGRCLGLETPGLTGDSHGPHMITSEIGARPILQISFINKLQLCKNCWIWKNECLIYTAKIWN